ncbi:hypothetical protein C0J52_09319 [Blattella germanica]|nr:hypothetical protein C0J52_09319 [Blattella germanica]
MEPNTLLKAQKPDEQTTGISRMLNNTDDRKYQLANLGDKTGEEAREPTVSPTQMQEEAPREMTTPQTMGLPKPSEEMSAT